MVDALTDAKARHSAACFEHWRALASIESTIALNLARPSEKQRAAVTATTKARADAEAEMAAIMETIQNVEN